MQVQGERFATMRRLFPDERTLVRVLGAFGDATRDDLRALGQAQERHDLHTLTEIAHKLKSACAQVDDADAARVLDLLEDAASMGSSPPLLASLVDDVLVRVGRLADDVDAFIASHESRGR